MRRLCCGVMGVLSLWSAAVLPASARPPQTLYERQRIERLLRKLGWQLDPQPQGKRIAFIRVMRDEVFVADELYPLWFNKFHWLTKASVIRRELRFAQGEGYDQARIEESERILRAMGIFALVRIVAVKTDDPQAVGILVHTRDLWSLRLETDFQVTGKQLDRLLLQLSERNLLGRQKQASVRYSLVPDTYTLGQSYIDRRLNGSELRLGQSAAAILNRDTNRVEGGQGSVSLGIPFYDLDRHFGFSFDASLLSEVERRLQGSQVIAYDIPETPEIEVIPSVWRERVASTSLVGRYRIGVPYRITFAAGWYYSQQAYLPNDETGLLPGQETAFARDVLPTPRRQIGPVFGYQLFIPDFVIFKNLDSFGQSEVVRRGPLLDATLRFPLAAFGSSSDSVTFSGRAGYTLAGRDAVAIWSVSGQARLEEGQVVDQRLRAEFKAAGPMWRFVRLVGRIGWDGRAKDTTRALVSLGGDNGLRGFSSQAFFVTGGSLLRGNLELRSRPIEWESVHLGGILFYDTGTVYGATTGFRMHHAAGIGARLLFPQFNRSPFRGDVGMPLSEAGGPVPSFGATQVVTFTSPDSAFGL